MNNVFRAHKRWVRPPETRWLANTQHRDIIWSNLGQMTQSADLKCKWILLWGNQHVCEYAIIMMLYCTLHNYTQRAWATDIAFSLFTPVIQILCFIYFKSLMILSFCYLPESGLPAKYVLHTQEIWFQLLVPLKSTHINNNAIHLVYRHYYTDLIKTMYRERDMYIILCKYV